MDLVGRGNFRGNFPPDMEQLLVRRGWSLLRMFGEDSYDRVDLVGGVYPNTETAEIDYESTASPYFQSPDARYSLAMNQFPHIGGEVVCDIGYVALFVEESGNIDNPELSQQMVFRLESHYDGPAVFVGDVEGRKLTQVTEPEDLLEISRFLDDIEVVCWRQYLDNPDSNIRNTPLSDIMNGAATFLMEESLGDD